MLLIKLKLQSFKRVVYYNIDSSNNHSVKLFKLEDLDEVRLHALDHLLEHYKKKKRSKGHITTNYGCIFYKKNNT